MPMLVLLQQPVNKVLGNQQKQLLLGAVINLISISFNQHQSEIFEE